MIKLNDGCVLSPVGNVLCVLFVSDKQNYYGRQYITATNHIFLQHSYQRLIIFYNSTTEHYLSWCNTALGVTGVMTMLLYYISDFTVQ